MQIQSTNESLKDPPMFVHSGGGGKGIRPNQHNQQQQQQAQQHHHHPTHHQTHHQTPHQQHQQHQAQLQTGSIHHSNQTTSQNSGNSHPHPQSTAPPPHQPPFQHVTFYQYPLTQIHQPASSSGQHHPGQNTSSNVGGSQLAPSPPTHTGGNGSQGASLGGGGGTGGGGGAGGSSSSGNTVSGGGGRQGQGASNTMSHYAPSNAIIQTALQQPTSNPFMPQTYILNQHNAAAVMLTQYSNSGGAAGQHTNPSGGQTAPLYQMPGQTSATHQQALHGGQPALQYYSNQAVAAPAQASMHHPPHHVRNMNLVPRQPYYFIQRPPLLTNAHQQPAAASGNTAVHVGTQLQNTGNRGATAGPTAYVTQPFCAPPLPMAAPGTLGSQPQSLLAATAIGAPPMQTAYGHMSGATTGSTSSASINIAAGSGAVGPTSSSLGSEHGGKKIRPHAIPIIDPLTMQTVSFEPQTKSATTSAVEIKAPSDMDNKPAKTSTVTLTAPPPETPATTATGVATKDNDKSITASVECAPETVAPPIATSDVGGAKDKIDQQMQTDVFVKDVSKTTTQPQAAAAAVIPPPTVQPCLEENDDTDADTPELEHDDDVVAAGVGIETQLMDDRAQTPSNVINESITKDCGGDPQVMDSDTDPTTETDVKSMSQMDEQLQTVDNEQFVEVKQQSPPVETVKSTGSKQPQYDQIPTTTNTTTAIAAGDKATKEDLHETEDSSITIQKKEAAATAEANDGAANNLLTTNKELISKTTKDQTKSSTNANTKMGVNTATTATSPTLAGNVNTNKKSISSEVATTQKPSVNTDVRGGAVAAQAAATQAAANDDAFITVSNRKNRRGSKQQQQQQQQHQQRTKDNQKKPQQQQQHHQQSQQQQHRQHERSNSTTSNTSSNNKSHNNNNNNTRNLSATPAAATAVPATNVHLTDIHNANSRSSSVNNGNNNKQQQTASSNNNNVNVEAVKAGLNTKDIDNNGKHVKSEEIAEQFLQPSAPATTPTAGGENAASKTEPQIQFLNSSSSACEDEEERLQLLRQQQQQKPQKQTPAPQQEEPTSPPATDVEKETNTAFKDVRFGDLKCDEKHVDGDGGKEVTKDTPAVAADDSTPAANVSEPTVKVSQPDTVDCSSNQPHSRPAVATLPSKPNKALQLTPSIQKHPKGKHNLRYSLEELKSLAKTEESQKLPVVPCQKGGCIAALFVARPNNQNLQHMQQQYQHISFNESMDFVPGKRRGGGAQRKLHDITASCGNIAGVGGPSGPGGSMVGMTGGSVSVTGTSFARPMKMIRVNLSLHDEVKLSECENAWQPESLRSKAGPQSGGQIDNLEAVLKKVRGVLNKLTPENFDVLLKTMTSISLDTPEKMYNVMLLIFEKTISEPNFAPTYAKFCKVLFNEVKPESKQHFNTSLIKRIQTEFETNVYNLSAKDEKLKPLLAKLEASTDPKERMELQAEVEDQEYQFRRRAWGTVRFIGEMFKLQSLTGDRVLICIESLLDQGSEEKLEYMCKLLTTVGHLLEDKNTKDGVMRMNKIFHKIHDIVKSSSRPGKHAKISSRVRFMMQDVIDLRNRQWDQKPGVTVAQTITVSLSSGGGSGGGNNSQQHQQRRRNQEDKNNRNNYDRGGSSQRMGGGGGGAYALNNQGRGMRQDNRDNYYNKNSQKSQYQAQDQNLDLKKLNFSRSDDTSQTTTKLGNSSAYVWRVSGKQTGSLLQNATAPPFGGMSASGSYSGSSGNNSNSANNTMKRHPTNPFQILSTREPDNDRHQNSDVERPSASQTSASSSCNEGSDDEEKPAPAFLPDEIRKLIDNLIDEYMDCVPSNSYNWQKEALKIWRANTLKQHVELVYYLLIEYLHLHGVDKDMRSALATIFAYLLRTKAFDKKTFARSYDQFSEEFADVLLDVPNGWSYVFEFLGPLLHDRLLTLEDIWREDFKSDRSFMQQFVKCFIVHFTKEFGANYVRDLWHKEYKLDRGQLFNDDNVQWFDFIHLQGLYFIYDANDKPASDLTSCNSSAVEKKVKRLEFLLKAGTNCDLAIDYINTNVNIDKEFLKSFASFLCCDHAIAMSSSSGSSNASSSTKKADNTSKIPQVNHETFGKICIPLLRLCIDAREDLELACLDAAYESIQHEYSDYAVVDDLTCTIFCRLYDSEIIAKESLDKWYRQHQASHGGSSSSSTSGGGGQQLSAQLQSCIQKIL